jgi:hypothetical protein
MLKLSSLAKAIGVAAVVASTSANATLYNFSYTFVESGQAGGAVINNGAVITGSFDGTGPISLVTNISNIHASLNGGPSVELFNWSYTPTPPGSNCGDPSCFTSGGAVASSNPLLNNFVFSNATTNAELAASSYFYIIQPWNNGPGNTIAAQFANGGSPNSYIDLYNGQYVPSNWSLTAAVPEPSTWAMMLLGFAGVGFMAYRRRNQSPQKA